MANKATRNLASGQAYFSSTVSSHSHPFCCAATLAFFCQACCACCCLGAFALALRLEHYSTKVFICLTFSHLGLTRFASFFLQRARWPLLKLLDSCCCSAKATIGNTDAPQLTMGLHPEKPINQNCHKPKIHLIHL